MDTTGSYEAQIHRLLNTGTVLKDKQSNINWENVSKRILPQLIFKVTFCARNSFAEKASILFAHLRFMRGSLSALGAHFAHIISSPDPLHCVNTISVVLCHMAPIGRLTYRGQLTTTVDQVALAFTAPSNLPEPGVYEQAIRAVITPESFTPGHPPVEGQS